VSAASSINGMPDDTNGVYLFSSGGDAGTCPTPTGIPGAQPTDAIIFDALNANLLEFVGDSIFEINDFDFGSNAEGWPDYLTLGAAVGLYAIDDSGLVEEGHLLDEPYDDLANADLGKGGKLKVS